MANVGEEFKKQMLSNQAKNEWVVLGRYKEKQFCRWIAPLLDLGRIEINPEKTTDKYAPDLVVEGRVADLKCQELPFFSAQSYDKDPTWTVTFNKKDLERYEESYDNLPVFFWVHWIIPEALGVKVSRINGVWLTTTNEIRNHVDAGTAPCHSYKERTKDNVGNAKESYLLDLREMETVKLFE